MADNIQLQANINLKLWESMKNKFKDLDEESLLTRIIEEYSTLLEIPIDADDITTELDERKKLTESLRKKCKNFASRVKDLEDIQADSEGSIEKLKKEIRKLSKGLPAFGEPKVKEKIVYREDTKTINELKEKRDALQKMLWEKNAELEQFDKTLTEIKQKLEEYETKMGKTYGFLARLEHDRETSKYQFSFETISRGEFNKLMRSKVEFCKYKKITTLASVIKLWETESDVFEIIDLADALNELRLKPDAKLTDISMPYNEYEALKNVEIQYHSIKEKHATQQSKCIELENLSNQLQSRYEEQLKELTRLKENPIVKEKIVYRENTKEQEELKAECERLRLKLFNYETGRMNVPTHGINVGNVYKVNILGVGKDGDGFTKVNNFIIFVPSTKKDQDCNIQITRVLKKYAFGKVTEQEENAPQADVIDTTSDPEGAQNAL